MDVLADAGARIRLHPADLPVLQAHLDLLAECREAGATEAELVAEVLRLQVW